ncbi:MAG: MarR family transcriptional regulator [Sulfurimonadaceae bacterium]|jgi:DNA-binding MarR family transcriptional regulator|nr:MarR family transcriptional regulator [Sulfurimonadaceae bacterium]
MKTNISYNYLIQNFYNKVDAGDLPSIFQFTFPIMLFDKTIFAYSENFYKEKYDLLKSEVDVLASLYTNDKELTPTQLYDLTIFSSGGMTKVLKRLELRGYIKRKAASKDKRCMLVCLTPSGEEVIKSSLFEISKEYESYFNTLSDTETKELGRLLQKLLYNLPKAENKPTATIDT